MTVKDILKTATTLLNRGDIKNYINGEAVNDYIQVEEDFNLLLDCYNLVEEEIATDYYRLKDTQTFTVVDGVIKCENFSKNVLAILSVKGLNGNAVNAEIKPDGIYTNEKNVVVEYVYVPSQKSIDENSSFFGTLITKRAIALGVITEFSLIKGDYEEAVTWHKKYITALTNCLASKKVKKIKERKWL
ncbi:MAG: hypothetical protein IKV61_05305 [Clostridia bacterium]|nr:hypothetical protein [Clostridia bacterium]